MHGYAAGVAFYVRLIKSLKEKIALSDSDWEEDKFMEELEVAYIRLRYAKKRLKKVQKV